MSAAKSDAAKAIAISVNAMCFFILYNIVKKRRFGNIGGYFFGNSSARIMTVSWYQSIKSEKISSS